MYIFPWIMFTALDFCPTKHRFVVPWASPFFIKQSACGLGFTAFHIQNILRLIQLSDTANSHSPSFLWNLRWSMHVILEWVKISQSKPLSNVPDINSRSRKAQHIQLFMTSVVANVTALSVSYFHWLPWKRTKHSDLSTGQWTVLPGPRRLERF